MEGSEGDCFTNEVLQKKKHTEFIACTIILAVGALLGDVEAGP